MDDKLAGYQKEMRRILNPVVLIFVFFEVVFLVFVVVILQNATRDEQIIPEVFVENIFEEVNDLSDSSREVILSELYSAISLNSSAASNINESGAVIRTGSLIDKSFDDASMHYQSFIVDIPSIEQSYRIYNENNDVMAMAVCVMDEERIYEDFGCVDNYGGLGRYRVVEQYSDMMELDNMWNVGGYTVYLPGDERVDGAVADKEYVEILAYCEDGTERKSAVQAVGEYFGELGFKLSDFNYEVVNSCERHEGD